MLYVGPYEVAIIVAVFCLITLGPVVAGLVVAWVRGLRGRRGGEGGSP